MKVIDSVEKICHRKLTRRVFVVKGLVTCSFFAYTINPGYGLVVATMGNILWLWVEV